MTQEVFAPLNIRTWSEMVKDGEGPYDSTGQYPCGIAVVGGYLLTEPSKFTIVKVADLLDLSRKLKKRSGS